MRKDHTRGTMMARKNDSYIRHSESLDTFGDAQFQVPQRTAVAQAITVALVAGVAPGTLLAQDDALDEITVTATKRAESVMDVPLAITALSGDFVNKAANLRDISPLSVTDGKGFFGREQVRKSTCMQIRFVVLAIGTGYGWALGRSALQIGKS